MKNKQEKLAHLLIDRDEAFATIAGILLGGYSEERKAFVLSKFQNTAKVVANVLKEKYSYETPNKYFLKYN